jgi:hypothetical protein
MALLVAWDAAYFVQSFLDLYLKCFDRVGAIGFNGERFSGKSTSKDLHYFFG